jgi:hypothetical protein
MLTCPQHPTHPIGVFSRSASDTLIDTDGHAFRAYGITDHALILVRPDGYIGLTAESFGQEPIIDYLRAITGQ